jgi:hypothetical protein
MAADLYTQLTHAANAAVGNRHGRPFLKALRTFVGLLRRVPDGGPSEFSNEQLMVIRQLAGSVVDEIEDRLEDADDSKAIQQELARSVYAIRDTVEEIYRWERHFARGRAWSADTREGDARG